MSLKVAFSQNLHPSAPTEWFMRMGGTRTERYEEKRAVMFVHGSGGTARQVWGDYYQRTLLRRTSRSMRRGTVLSADWGYETWGNDIAMARMDEGWSYLQYYGADYKIGLVGGSMGSCNILNWAWRNPSKVAFVAAMIPLVDIADIRANYPTAVTGTNAAYGGAYNDATHGLTHSPIHFASDIDSNIPITLFTASDDTLCLPATATAFIAARPETQRVNLGAVGHTSYAMFLGSAEVANMAKEYTS